MTARVYAVLVFVFGISEIMLGIYILRSGGHAAAGGLIFVVPGLVLAPLGPALWLGAKWVSPFAFAFSLFPSVVPLLWSGLPLWWKIPGLGGPVLFLIFTVLLLVTRPNIATPIDQGQPSAPTVPQVFAAVVLTYGLLLALLGALSIVVIGGRGTYFVLVLFALPGVALFVLSRFIWRERVWAMIAAFAAFLVPWGPILWQATAGGPTLDWYMFMPSVVVPTLFGILAGYSVLSVLKGRTDRSSLTPS